MNWQLSWLDRTQTETEAEKLPWYVSLMQGFAGWLASLALIGFLATTFTWLFDLESPWVLSSIGASACAAAFIGLRRLPGVFFGQMCLVLSLTGQVLFAFAVIQQKGFNEVDIYWILAAFQAILALTMPMFLHRLMSSCFALVALFLGFELTIIDTTIVTAIAALLSVWIWIKADSWGVWQKILEPIALALLFALLYFNSVYLSSLFLGLSNYIIEDGSYQWTNPFIWLSNLLWLAAFGLFAGWQLRLHSVLFISVKGAFVAIAVLLAAMADFWVSDISGALLILLIGVAHQRKTLVALGVLGLLSFLSWYYYNLAQTLLFKSMVLIGLGSGLLLAFYVIKVLLNDQPPGVADAAIHARAAQDRILLFSKTSITLVASVIIALGVINHAIYKKELLLAEGKQVFLELAPLDPRSIMQGDYMRLNFVVAREAQQVLSEQDSSARITRDAEGYLVLDIAENGVGQLSRVVPEFESVKDNQAVMHYRMRKYRLQLATNAFFFQEGRAETFEQAKYGEFRVDVNGEVVLNTLRDKDLKILGYHRP